MSVVRSFAALTFAASLLLTGNGAVASEAEVGEVSLVIGSARAIAADGRVTPIVRGQVVRSGDRIETDEGGHVHLRFVDGGFASVRPGSRLVIESYRVDAQDPRQNVIRFRLDHGVVRSVTGRGAEAARDRFRLNTPIAAIGVRGTDFVVAADSELTRISVHSGAVVAAPLGAGCQAEGLGPCDTAAARLLSADMGNLMLELQRQQGTPRLVPLAGQPLPEKPTAGERAAAPVDGGTRTPGRQQEPVGEALAVQNVTAGAETIAAVVQPPTSGKSDSGSRPAEKPTGEAPVKPPAPPATLAWGHWAYAQKIAGDTLSVTQAEAREGREVTLGNDYWGLYRPVSEVKLLPTDLGRAEFTLRDAEVFLVGKSSSSAGSVKDGWLGVDFATRQFATRLDVHHDNIGDRQLAVQGDVRKDGLFVAQQGDLRVAGALTMDGQEAGYAFTQNLGTLGVLTGITRWYR